MNTANKENVAIENLKDGYDQIKNIYQIASVPNSSMPASYRSSTK